MNWGEQEKRIWLIFVINLADFNNALLNKWMWKIFDDTDEQIWPNLVLNNYYRSTTLELVVVA